MLFRMRGSRPALLLGAAALLLLVVLAARGESPVPFRGTGVRLPRGDPEADDDAAEDVFNLPTVNNGDTPATVPEHSGLSGDIIVWVAVVLVVLACVLSVLSWLRTRRRVGVGDVLDPVEGTVDPDMRLRLRNAVEQARDLLARPGGESRDAVIKAWVTLENATEHRREPHQTSTEFATVLVNDENADDLRELRTLYQRARFGHHSGAGDARQAREALDRILVTLR
jgi:hypothetical protein